MNLRLWSFLFLFFCAFHSENIFASEADDYKSAITNVVDILCRMNKGDSDLSNKSCGNMEKSNGETTLTRRCFKNLDSKLEISLHLTLGYFEREYDNPAHPYQSWDHYIHHHMVEFLQKKCPNHNMFACGFEMDNPWEYYPAILKKTITLTSGFTQTVRLTLMSSSIGTNNDENVKSPEQIERSKKAEDHFLSGLKSADASFYIGHGRKVGMPSFSPPKLILDASKKLRIDYDEYQREKIGKRNMLAAMKERKLQESNSEAAFLSLQSCGSERSLSEIERIAPKTSLLLTKNTPGGTSYHKSITTTLFAIDSFLAGRCQNEFALGLKTKLGDDTQMLIIKK